MVSDAVTNHDGRGKTEAPTDSKADLPAPWQAATRMEDATIHIEAVIAYITAVISNTNKIVSYISAVVAYIAAVISNTNKIVSHISAVVAYV